MKYLIVLSVASAVAMAGCGAGSDSTPVSAVKTPAANAQFKGSDHMPPEARAAAQTGATGQGSG